MQFLKAVSILSPTSCDNNPFVPFSDPQLPTLALKNVRAWYIWAWAWFVGALSLKNTGIETYGHHLTRSLNDEKTTLCPKDLISSFAHVLILPNVAVLLRFMLLCESDRSCSLLLVYISLIKKEQVSGVSRGTLGSLGLEGL